LNNFCGIGNVRWRATNVVSTFNKIKEQCVKI